MNFWLRTLVLISAVLHVTSSPATDPFASEEQTPMTIEDSSNLSETDGRFDGWFPFGHAGNFDFGTLTSQRLVQFEDGPVQSMTEWEKVRICIYSDLEAI